MSVYVIGYDLHPKKGETYDELIKALNAYGKDAWHCLDSTWLIKTTKTTAELRDEIWKHMNSDDQLLVLKYTESTTDGRWAYGGFKGPCGQWIKDNL